MLKECACVCRCQNLDSLKAVIVKVALASEITPHMIRELIMTGPNICDVMCQQKGAILCNDH